MQWRRDLWLLVLAVGAGLFVAGERTLAATNDPSLVTPLLLIGAVTAPAAFAALSFGRELRCSLPGWIVAGVTALAGLFGAAVAGLLTYGTLTSLGLLPTLAVAIAEEGIALAVPAAALWVLPSRRAVDGLVVGVAAGAGFAATEALSYLVAALVGHGGALGSTVHELLVRGLLGPAVHLAWTGIAAASLWLAVREGWKGRALRRFVVAAVGVVLLHLFWELGNSIPVRIVVTALTLTLFGWVVRHLTPVRKPTIRRRIGLGRSMAVLGRAAHHNRPAPTPATASASVCAPTPVSAAPTHSAPAQASVTAQANATAQASATATPVASPASMGTTAVDVVAPIPAPAGTPSADRTPAADIEPAAAEAEPAMAATPDSAAPSAAELAVSAEPELAGTDAARPVTAGPVAVDAAGPVAVDEEPASPPDANPDE